MVAIAATLAATATGPTDRVSAALRNPPNKAKQQFQSGIRSWTIKMVRRVADSENGLTRDQFCELIHQREPRYDAKRLFYSLLTRGMLVTHRDHRIAGVAFYKPAGAGDE